MVAYTAADVIVPEAGLLGRHGLGLALANHHRARTEQIIRFAEEVRVLLIGVLFIVLSARLTRTQLGDIGLGAVGLIAALMLVARPLSVSVATIGSNLKRNERWFLAGLAPRGIVAAAIASIFAIELEEAGVQGAESLAPLVFAVIVATVVIYGLGAGPLARRLGLAARHQEGVLILGAGQVERAVAGAFDRAGITVVIATVNREKESAARMAGHNTFFGNVLDENVDLSLDLAGVGRLDGPHPQRRSEHPGSTSVRRHVRRRARRIRWPPSHSPLVSRGAPPTSAGGCCSATIWTTTRSRRCWKREPRCVRHHCRMSSVLLSSEPNTENPLRCSSSIRGGRVRVATADQTASLLAGAAPGDELIWIRRDPIPSAPVPSAPEAAQ